MIYRAPRLRGSNAGSFPRGIFRGSDARGRTSNRPVLEPLRPVAESRDLTPLERVALSTAVNREVTDQVQIENRRSRAAEQGTKNMSITGAAYLGAQARSRVQAAKDKIAKATERLGGAMDELDRSTGRIDDVAKAIEQEAADLTAAAAQLTNGPPLDAE
jgi:hypothetical protein